MKFDAPKTEISGEVSGKKEKIEKLSRKIVTSNLKDGIRYIFGRFLWEQARACFPDEPHCDFVELMMDLKERKIIANIASYDGRRDYEITMTADEMHEIAINNGIDDIMFMEKEDDWKTLFDNCEEHLRSINEGSTASSVKPPLLSKKKVDVDVAENRYRVLERTVNAEAKQKTEISGEVSGKMHEIAINNGIDDIVFMEKEDDWKTLFDNCEEYLRSINEGSTASSVKPPLLSKKKVDVDVAENRYRVLERTVNTEAKQKTEISGEASGKMKTEFFTCFACKKLMRAESSAYVNEKVYCRSCFYVELKGMKATVNKREKSIESLCSIDGIKKFSMHGSIMQAADKLLEGGFVFVSAQTGGGLDEIFHTGAKAYNAVYTDYAMFRNMESDHKKREEEERKVSDGWIATLDYSYIIAEFKHNEMNVRMAAEGKRIIFAWSNMTEKEAASARVFVEMIREILTDEKTEDERTEKKSAEEIQDILWVRNESGISPGDVIVIKSNLGFGWGHEETRYGIEVKEDGYHIECTTSAPMAGCSDESHDLPVGYFFRTTNENIKKYFAGYSNYIEVKPEDIKDEDIARLKKYDYYCMRRNLMTLLCKH